MGTDILAEIVKHKKQEIAAAKIRLSESELRLQANARLQRRPFFAPLSAAGHSGVNIIAEIKRASPSKGEIRKDLDAGSQARVYEVGGASAVSVLTDARFFKGGPQDLVAAKEATQLPVLRKDFVISAYQIYESIVMGADAVLLIVRILSPQQLKDYLMLCAENRIDALVEVHSESEYAVAARAGARLIGINNRDLDTFTTNINTSIRLASLFEAHQVGVAESGIADRKDMERIMAAGIYNFLIGESLVRAPDTQEFLRSLIGN